MLERVAGSRARKSTQSRPLHPFREERGIGIGAGDQRGEPADRIRPAERVEIVLDAEHRWRVDRLAGEHPLGQLAAARQAEDLWQRPGRPVGLQALGGARRKDQHAVLRLAAQHLLPGEGDDIELVEGKRLRKGGARRVADRQARAIRRDPVAVRHPHAGGRAVPGEDHVAREIDCRQVGQFAIGRFEHAHVGQPKLLHDVGHPAEPEAFPGEHVDAARAEQRPERHLHGAGIGCGHDARCGSPPGRAAVAASRRSPASDAPCRASSDASVRPAHPSGFRGTSRAAWRWGRRKSADSPAAMPASRSSPWCSTLPDRRPSVGRGLPPPRLEKSAVRRKLLESSCPFGANGGWR